jgi:NDP-hexose 4-ketoreductase
MTADAPLIVTGANGRIGRLLRNLWADKPPKGLLPIWMTRAEWNIGVDAPPELPTGGVLLDLAGVTRGDFERNPFLASKVADLSQQLGCKLIYVSSASVYPGGAMDMDEDQALAPVSAYGRSKVAAEVTVRAVASNPTILRLGNIAGADALLAGNRSGLLVSLDQSTSGNRGPVRSYIGPHVLADVLSLICSKAIEGIGHTLNVAQPDPVAMADLLDAAGYDWLFRDPREGVIDQVALSLGRLQALMPVPPATAPSLVEDLRRLGGWP